MVTTLMPGWWCHCISLVHATQGGGEGHSEGVCVCWASVQCASVWAAILFSEVQHVVGGLTLGRDAAPHPLGGIEIEHLQVGADRDVLQGHVRDVTV